MSELAQIPKPGSRIEVKGRAFVVRAYTLTTDELPNAATVTLDLVSEEQMEAMLRQFQHDRLSALPGLPVNWPSPSTNTPNVDEHPLEHYWSDREKA